MKFLDETGLKFIATKFKELRESLSNKVDKVENKQLSTNDYTNEAKTKVDAIPTDPKYTDTVQDLSGYAKKKELPDSLFLLNDKDEILARSNFENIYLNTKIESEVDWYHEFFPRGVYFFRMINTEGAPEDRYDFIVMTSYNADVDVFYDDIQVHSRVIEQVAISLNTGKIYERYIDTAYNKAPISFGIPSSEGCSIYGVRGNWTKWQEITKDFAKKDDIIKALSDYAKKSDIPTLEEKEKLKQLPYVGQLNEMLDKKLNKTDKADMANGGNFEDDKSYTTPKFVSNAVGALSSELIQGLSDGVQEELNKKVDKEDGKVLSDFNFSAREKSKLHRLPTTEELGEAWEKKANRTELKTKLSEMTDDATHRLVTDAEKTNWSGKIDNDQLFVKESYTEQKKKYGDDKIIPTIKSFRNSLEGLEKSIKSWANNMVVAYLKDYKQQIILTQTEYNALSSTDKNDSSKIYFIKG